MELRSGSSANGAPKFTANTHWQKKGGLKRAFLVYKKTRLAYIYVVLLNAAYAF